ncbi:MAG: GNAT family N-acetyltransferase [Ilumatobacteraceae bacterium]
MFEPIRTERLLIRAPLPADVEALHARRNDPAIEPGYQGWSLPYDRERAQELIDAVTAMAGPTNDEWWMATVCLGSTGEPIGDLALHLEDECRTAEIGYTFAAAHWGNGYAFEAAEALVEWLFDEFGVHRVAATMHPDNVASTIVAERLGMRYEGRTRGSYWLGDHNSDNQHVGMLRADWEPWRDRVRTPPVDVHLAEVDQDSVGDVYKLRTHHFQEAFVAPMADSFADALFPEVVDDAPVVPWMRAVVADDEIAGFAMMALVTDHHPEPYVWRLLIDRMHQRRGIGGRVLDLLGDECRAQGHDTLLTSWTEGRGSPRDFYVAHGFVPTGRIVDDETEARRRL